MATHDSNPSPNGRPKRRMVLRRIGETSVVGPAPRPPLADAPAAHVRRPSSATLRPPPPPDSEPVPIPLTRLQTPRPRYRSAIDLPPHASSSSGDEALLRESSSTTLPPLVASIFPSGPAASAAAPHPGALYGAKKMVALGGAAALGALVLVLGGVALGERAHRSDEPALRVVAPMPANAHDEASARRVAASGGAAAPGLPVERAPVEGTALPVESLPRAAPSPHPRAAPVSAFAHAVPAAVHPSAPSVAHGDNPAAAGVAAATPAPPAAAHAPATDTPSSEEDGTAVAVAPKAALPLPSDSSPPAQTAKEVPSDPLVKAVRDDIEEEEARRGGGPHGASASQ